MSLLRDKLIRSLPRLNDQLDNQDIADYLVGDGVLTAGEYDELYTLVRTTGRHAGNRMRTHLLIQKHDSQVARFMSRLRERQPDLAGDVEQCTVDELYRKTCWIEERTALEEAVVPERPKPPLPETNLFHEAEARIRDEAKREMEATLDALYATFIELTSEQFQRATRDERDQAIAKACAHHKTLYMNTVGCLKKFQVKGHLPNGTNGCNACALDGSLYISVCRGESNVRRLYSCAISDLERGNWTRCALPLNEDIAWDQVKIFAGDDGLYCAATENPKTHVYKIFQRHSGGDWRFIADTARVRYDFRIACLHGMLVMAGGSLADGAPCHDVDAYQLESERWVQLAVDDHHRCIPAVLSDTDNDHIYILGGTGGGDGDITSQVAVTTLIRRSSARYDRVPRGVTNLPVHATFAAAGPGSAIVIAGGCMLDDGSGQRGQLSDQCSTFDHMARKWRALPPLCTKQSNPELIVHGGKVICLWGLMDNGKKCEQIQVLDL